MPGLASLSWFIGWVATLLGGGAALMALVVGLGVALDVASERVRVETTVAARAYSADKVRLSLRYTLDGEPRSGTLDVPPEEGMSIVPGDTVSAYATRENPTSLTLEPLDDATLIGGSALASLLLVPGLMLVRRRSWQAAQVASGARDRRRLLHPGERGYALASAFETVRDERAWIYLVPFGGLLLVGNLWFLASDWGARDRQVRVQGEVVSVRVRPTPYGYRDDVIYAFDHGGRRFGGTFQDHDDGRWRAGAPIDIVVDPDDPTSSRPADRDVGWTEIVLAGLGLLMLAAGLGAWRPTERLMLRALGYAPR